VFTVIVDLSMGWIDDAMAAAYCERYDSVVWILDAERSLSKTKG
jgi:hypothetical protein